MLRDHGDSSTVMNIDEGAPMGGGSEAPAPAAPDAPADVQAPVAEEAAPIEGEEPVAEEAPVAEEPQFDPSLMPDIQRLLGGIPQQQQSPPPFDPSLMQRAFAPVLDPVVQQNKALMDIIQRAEKQQQQAALEATRPVPPGPEATAAEHLKYIHDNLKWEQAQASKGVESKIDTILKTFEQQQQQQRQAYEQQQQQMQRARMDQAYQVGIQQLARAPQMPQMRVFENPDAAAALRAIHERLPQMSLPQVANLMLGAFGLGPKTPAAAAADRRTQENAALQQRRAQVRNGGKPMPAGGNAGKAGAPPKGAREAAMLAMQKGARLNPDLLRSLNIDPNKVN